MRAGPLDRLITIQRKAITYSSAGDPEETWTTIASRRPASMKPVRGEERLGDPQTVAREQIEFRVRYSFDVSTLTPQDRIVYPALAEESPEDIPEERAIHDVLAVHEIGRREGLQIITARRVDVLSA